MITHAFMDLDSVAYLGACIAEKRNYQYTNKVTGEKSEVFAKAEEGKGWLETEIAFQDLNPDDWERSTIIVEQPLEIAIKGVEYELNSWIRTAQKLSNNPDIKLSGMLTSSGLKTKDIEGLEDRYQYNRYDCRKEWIPKPKPKHLSGCRDYLLMTYDWIKMSPKGIEADAPMVYFAEKRGFKAVCMSKDKDLKQVMNTHFIDMNEAEKYRELTKVDTLGYLELEENAKGVKTLRGTGFKLICAQTFVGDPSDGYKGLFRVGPAKAVELLDDCKTPEECCKVVAELYESKFPKGKSYKDWTGNKVTRTWEELLIQHCMLAYHERGAKDTSNPMERYLKGEDPIFKVK